jgi:hypothetical protein
MRLNLRVLVIVFCMSASFSWMASAQSSAAQQKFKLNCSECMPGVDPPPPPPPEKQVTNPKNVGLGNLTEASGAKKPNPELKPTVKLGFDEKVFTRDLRSNHFSGRKP